MRRLIINADDFGLTSGVNRAIVEGNRSGVVTSATLMANAQASAAAIELAKAEPGLKTGCHVVLIDGQPLTNGSARFRSSLKQFALAAVRKQIAAEEIEREVAAQVGKILASGITL
ncbi:MAG TPA: ChbG/HpnK family deacetylase, partial [Candidatus Angelobacter sp.]|nr:ChbG/HpnK family deacetylase [Candidatus Angelobacter sp.]